MRARQYIRISLQTCLVLCLFQLAVLPLQASAITAAPIPDPKSGSYGLEATKKQAPPTTGAVITIPGSGSSFSTSPITVAGTCPAGDLLVQVYNNGVMVGSIPCKNGSFSLQVSLFSGQNELTAIVFDNLDQAGPVSNIVTVTYNNTTFTAFGALITLTSNYGRRSASPGTTLNWPLQLSGGTGPYAFSTNWGDGSASDLKSQPIAGDVNISHVYSKSGIYNVTVKATDVNGVSAFLQVVAISKGNITVPKEETESKNTAATTNVLWAPAAVACLLLFPTFWLGRRSELVSLHKKLAKEVENYKEK